MALKLGGPCWGPQSPTLRGKEFGKRCPRPGLMGKKRVPFSWKFQKDVWERLPSPPTLGEATTGWVS